MFKRRRHHRERMRCRAREEPDLCCVRILHDQLYLPSDCGLDLGRRLARQHLRCGIYGLRRIRFVCCPLFPMPAPQECVACRLSVSRYLDRRRLSCEGQLYDTCAIDRWTSQDQASFTSPEAFAALLARPSSAPERDASRIPKSSSTTMSHCDRPELAVHTCK